MTQPTPPPFREANSPIDAVEMSLVDALGGREESPRAHRSAAGPDDLPL